MEAEDHSVAEKGMVAAKRDTVAARRGTAEARGDTVAARPQPADTHVPSTAGLAEGDAISWFLKLLTKH